MLANKQLHRVLESIKAGVRLPEARYVAVKLGGYGQKSVYGAFKTSKLASSAYQLQKR
jgi:hypothetical protein